MSNRNFYRFIYHEVQGHLIQQLINTDRNTYFFSVILMWQLLLCCKMTTALLRSHIWTGKHPEKGGGPSLWYFPLRMKSFPRNLPPIYFLKSHWLEQGGKFSLNKSLTIGNLLHNNQDLPVGSELHHLPDICMLLNKLISFHKDVSNE